MRRFQWFAIALAASGVAACAGDPTSPTRSLAPHAANAVIAPSTLPDTVSQNVVIWEDGVDPTTGLSYEVIEYPAGASTTGGALGSVVLYWRALSPTVIQTNVYRVKAQAGWTSQIQVASSTGTGGVKVYFTNGTQQFTFTASYVPGKTKIDGGQVTTIGGGGGGAGGGGGGKHGGSGGI